MTARELFQKLIEEMPSRGLDAVDIYIHTENNEGELDCFKIKNISNEGTNDAIFIHIEKIC